MQFYALAMHPTYLNYFLAEVNTMATKY